MAPALVSGLAHVELLSPDPVQTARFLVGVGALTLVSADRRSSYLRAGDDPYSYSLQLTAADVASVGHVAWRASSPRALTEAVAALAASGRGLGWTPGDVGHGPAYRFQSPSGHVHELLWEADPRPPDRAGVATTLRGLDHVALTCTADPARDAGFFAGTLAFRRIPSAEDAVALLSATGEAYHLGFVATRSAPRRGLDHLGMALAPGGPTRLTAPGGHRLEAACAEAAVSHAFSRGFR